MINASRGNILNKAVQINENAKTANSSLETKISTSVAYKLENYKLR